MTRWTLLATIIALPCLAGVAAGQTASWPTWRGPDGTGYVKTGNPPTTWSEERNIRWKVEIPGGGHASPIVHGDRVYVMTAVKTERAAAGTGAGEGEDGAAAASESTPPAGRGRRGGRGGRGGFRGEQPSNVYEFHVLALNRADGSTVWSTRVREEVPHEGTHRTGSFASGSPLTDGQHIYAFFGSRGLFCLDMNGTVKWEKDLGNMRTRNAFGEGGSPALHGDTLVVPWDHEGDSFVVALNKRTGDEIWRVDRDEPTTWTTPVIVEANGRTQAIIAGTNASVSYDLKTGEEIWRCSGLTTNVIPTPVLGHGMVYLTSGFRGNALQAVKLAEASGDITGTDAIAWSHGRGTPYVPSPMLAGRNLYFLKSNSGIVSCFDALTGKPHYSEERLDVISNVYASPVGAGRYVYICSREGDVAVLEDGPELKVIATNSIGEGIDATPAIVGDEIYLRGSRHLFCIAKTE
ncbi:MAG: outer membrane protein assembly factor BamB family protein [Planctomycetota bacterium]|jgi:outer membrane protein assembly factor BamB